MKQILSLDDRCRNDVAVFNKFDANGILFFKKYAFADRLFTLILVNRKKQGLPRIFSDIVIFIRKNSINTIAGDFSYDY